MIHESMVEDKIVAANLTDDEANVLRMHAGISIPEEAESKLNALHPAFKRRLLSKAHAKL